MPHAPSRPARAGYVLVSLMLVFVIAFGALALASIAVGIARDGNSILWGDTLAVPVELDPDSIGPLPAGLELAGWPAARIEIRDPTTEQMLLRSLVDLGPLVLFVAVLWSLRGLARSVTEGDPFNPRNVRRVRSIGFTLVVGAPLIEIIGAALRERLFTILPVTGANIGSEGFNLPGVALLAGLGTFILAEVFAHGVRLREDIEGTV
jgi:hypothetical protein